MIEGMPPHISCPECKEEGKHIMHIAFTTLVEDNPEGEWNWELTNHDGTSKWQWPTSFLSRDAAKAHIQEIMDSAEQGVEVV